MKRFLPLLAMSAMFIAAPAFAQDAVTADSEAQIIAQGPSTAVVAPDRERINLSDAQLEQLRAIKDKTFADTAVKKAQLSVLKHNLRSAMTSENVDRNAVMSLQSQINAMQADLSNTKVAAMLDARNVFTPEQRKLMHSRMLHHGFGGRHHGHKGWGGGKGGCGGPRGHKGFGGHRGFGGPGGPGPGAHAMEDGAPDPEATAELPPMDAPDFDGLSASLPPMDGPDFDGE